MADLAENTEALKRNFLFRGYFNRRGYFDLDDVSPEEYRRGALESAGRRPCGSGCEPTCCSSGTRNGNERLSEGGKARLNSAMSMFVKYPKSSLWSSKGTRLG